MKLENVQDAQLAKWLGAAALGAVAMYMLDPERGAPRRAVSGEKLRRLGRQTGDALDKVVHELGTKLGNAQITASQVIDEATAMAAPQRPLERTDHLKKLSLPDDRIGQGIERPLSRAGNAWGGGRRGAALAGGGALGLVGLLSPRSPMALLLGLAGLTLLARGATNRPLRSMLPSGARSAPLLVEKSIRIDAAPEQVFDLFAHYENFPRYLSNVVDVRDLGNRRSHWIAKGPAGTEFSWNSVLTDHSRPRRLAWKTEPGAEVEQSGEILFDPVRGGTRVTVHLSYRPPAGAIGRALASLLGSDPQHQLEQDLRRMKTLVERDAVSLAGMPGELPENRVLH